MDERRQIRLEALSLTTCFPSKQQQTRRVFRVDFDLSVLLTYISLFRNYLESIVDGLKRERMGNPLLYSIGYEVGCQQ